MENPAASRQEVFFTSTKPSEKILPRALCKGLKPGFPGYVLGGVDNHKCGEFLNFNVAKHRKHIVINKLLEFIYRMMVILREIV